MYIPEWKEQPKEDPLWLDVLGCIAIFGSLYCLIVIYYFLQLPVA